MIKGVIMETEVREHKSHSRSGKAEEVRAHEMHVNEKVHERHQHKLEEEAKELERMAHEHVKHAREHRRLVKV